MLHIPEQEIILTWPGPKPAKRPSECFGFFGLLVGPVGGGPEIEDCLEMIHGRNYTVRSPETIFGQDQ